MAISFNKESVFNLTPITPKDLNQDVRELLIEGEKIACAFKTVRDQLVFTNKRIIAMDIQGITGKRRSFTTMPYSKIQYFAIQTPGLIELFPDSELFIMFTNGYTATFEFKGKVNIAGIGRMLSEYVL